MRAKPDTVCVQNFKMDVKSAKVLIYEDRGDFPLTAVTNAVQSQQLYLCSDLRAFLCLLEYSTLEKLYSYKNLCHNKLL